MEQRSGHPDEEEVQDSPIPPDAPVETPQADPRTKGAPDSDGTDPEPDPSDATEEQIQEAFE